jgi:hypothetical protein
VPDSSARRYSGWRSLWLEIRLPAQPRLPSSSKEAQAVLQKYEFRSSHLVEGTMMAKYLPENRIKVLDAKQQNDFYLQGEATGLKLKEELAKIMKQ